MDSPTDSGDSRLPLPTVLVSKSADTLPIISRMSEPDPLTDLCGKSILLTNPTTPEKKYL